MTDPDTFSPETPSTDTLSEDIQDALEELCDQGNEAMDEGEFREAITFFEKALEILPAPADEWEPYGWLQAALGDAYYGMQDYNGALEYFHKAYTFAGPDEVNPFVLLRLGQSYRRLGDAKNALDYLLRAYMLEGEDIFANDDDDFAFLKETAPL
ncbi:Tetratricopeptide repeat protein [uncultured delta proteobacterium]|uniref:Tetratricopeptide repeat protein n=1 Tax=uncultured delta proteobacterium TaxID=34034 RepID=A0A212KHB4_9DELT|nr:Tetratricopeptide repeat protein [uncultured delta proteobacterium]